MEGWIIENKCRSCLVLLYLGLMIPLKKCIVSQFRRWEVQYQGVGRVGSFNAMREGSIPGLSCWLIDASLLPADSLSSMCLACKLA